MGVKITVELPEDLLRRAQNFAARSGRPFEAAVVELIDRGVTEPEVERLADNEILALCDSEMDAAQQEQLRELLDLNREGPLPAAKHTRLDELMRAYRRGLVRKAQAWNTAVAHGLRASLH